MHLLLALAIVTAAPPALAQDLDRDGLDDRLEQALLERFLPTFLLSAGECDGLPASFESGSPAPRLLAKDGTIYGHVFPIAPTDGALAAAEIQYFHLWAKDCGRGGHPLDAEHVSALVESTSLSSAADEWTARLWYAAAHEDTICDASSTARASSLDAERAGPRIFVSRGKHASYLTRGPCKWGCGVDICGEVRPMVAAAIINVGEPGAPLNGAEWVASPRWRLAEKLRSDFDPAIRSKLDASKSARVISLMIHLRAPQSPVLVGDTALDVLATTGRSTTTALSAAGDATATAIWATTRAVGRSMKRTVAGVARFLRLTP